MKRFRRFSSEARITLPSFLRHRLGLKQNDRLEATIEPDSRQVTIKPAEIDDQWSERISGYAKPRVPVLDVDTYYQEHRSN